MEKKELILSRETPEISYEAWIGDILPNGKKALYGHKKTLIANLQPFFPNIKKLLKKAKGKRNPFFEDLTKFLRNIKEMVDKIPHFTLSPDELRLTFKVGDAEYYLTVENLSLPNNAHLVSVYLWKDNELLAEISNDYSTLYENDLDETDPTAYDILLLAEELAEKYIEYDFSPTVRDSVKKKETPIVEFWI